jgi:hypothetical protein
MGRIRNKQAFIIFLIQTLGPFGAIGIAILIAPYVK